MIPTVFLPEGPVLLDGGIGQELYSRLGNCCEIGPKHIAYLRQALGDQRFPIRSHSITESL